jgi:hypothetical protein
MGYEIRHVSTLCPHPDKHRITFSYGEGSERVVSTLCEVCGIDITDLIREEKMRILMEVAREAQYSADWETSGTRTGDFWTDIATSPEGEESDK